MVSNRDLRKFQDCDVVAEAFGKIVSGRAGYRAVIEKNRPPTVCPNEQCKVSLTGEEKFCPECGTKTNFS